VIPTQAHVARLPEISCSALSHIPREELLVNKQKHCRRIEIQKQIEFLTAGDATTKKAFLLKREFLRTSAQCPEMMLGTGDIAGQISARLCGIYARRMGRQTTIRRQSNYKS